MRRIILFDGVCNFCNRTVNTIIAHDKLGRYQFAPLQSKAAAEIMQSVGLDPKLLSTVIFVNGNEVYVKTDAIIKIAANLSGWPSMFSVLKLLPKCIRDLLYDLVAKYRYTLFGQRQHCMLPDKNISHRFLS